MSSVPAPRLGARACLAVFLLALGIRLAATAAVGFSSLDFGDALPYVETARSLVETGRYPLLTDVSFFRAPGYPVFLVAATLGNPERIAWAKLANVVVGSLSTLLLALLSVRLFRRRKLALATGVVAALHPSFVLISTEVQSEPLFLFLFLASGLLLLSGTDRPSSSQGLLAGALFGLAALTRPSALTLTPLLLAPLLDRRHPRRARAHLAASGVLGFVLALSPWTLRNAIVFRELIPINDAAANAFYQGNSDWHLRFHEIRSRSEYDRWIALLHHDMRRQMEALDAATQGSPTARSRHFIREAVFQRLEDPESWARLLLLKAWDWVRPYPNRWFWPLWVVLGTGVYYIALTAFAVFGLIKAERRGAALFCVALLAISMAAHVVVMVVWRYRVPYWDPVLLLYGVFGAGITLGRVWKRRAS